MLVWMLASESFDDTLLSLYRDRARSLTAMLYAYTGSRADAEDLCHEAFLRVGRVRPAPVDSANLWPYLRVTAFNLARSAFRRRRVAARHISPAEPGLLEWDETAPIGVEQSELLAAVRRLPSRQRECVVLRYWYQLSDTEIAAHLGLSANSVKTHQRRARSALERRLQGARCRPDE